MSRILTCAVCLLTAASAFAAEPPAPVGVRIADFALPDAVGGKDWKLSEATRDAKATVIVFINPSCPVSIAYAPRFALLQKKYADKGVAFALIDSHPTDTAVEMATHAKDFGIPFPILNDDGTKIADRFNVERAPTAYVLDAGKTVRYKGRIDDQHAPMASRPKPTTSELTDAIAAVLAGKEVTTPYAAAVGCKLTREHKPVAGGSAVTYHQHVSRILQAKCQDCHRPGEPAPFSLLTFKQAKGWADTIRETVANDAMPPWHADAPRGHFLNDRRLDDDQKKTLLAWVDQGCAEGDPKDAPPAKTYVDGWRLTSKPDMIFAMEKSIDVPAQYLYGLAGGMPYQYVPAGEKFKEDAWIQEVEIRPGFRSAIHHVIAYVVPPSKTFFDVAGPDFGKYMLCAYVPGDDAIIFPAGMAKKVPKGSQILFEMHYTPNGKPGRDQSVIGLVLSKEPPKYVSMSDAIFNEKFSIPPGDANHAVTARRTFAEEVMLTALTPHMHLRGKLFKYELLDGETGKVETLLSVPKYDFNWQVAYVLAKPRRIPAKSAITCTALYDNSDKNPVNPNPKNKVRWGEQTWEEMMIGFVEYYVPR